MALTESEAKILAALIQADEALTRQELRAQAGLSNHGARTATRALIRRGLVSSTDGIPAYYRPTDTGRSEVRRPVYQEFLSPSNLTTATSIEGR